MAKLNPIRRVLAVIMLIPILLTLIPPTTVYAASADGVYIETLVNPDSVTYITNVITDTFSKNKKYDYKYTQISSYLKNACGDGSSNGIEGSKQNANYCYTLNDDLNFDTTELARGWTGSLMGMSQAEFFINTEGYFDSGSGGTLEALDGSNDNPKQNSMSITNSAFYSSSSKNTETAILEYPANTAQEITPKENDYAIEIASTLTSSLNQILNIVNGGKKYSDIYEFVNKSIMIRPISRSSNIAVISPAKSGENVSKGYVIVYAPNGEDSTGEYSAANVASKKEALEGKSFSNASGFFTTTNLPKKDENGNLIAYIFEMNKTDALSSIPTSFQFTTDVDSPSDGDLNPNTMASVIYAMPKGYATPLGEQHPLFLDSKSGGEQAFAANDIPYLTIHILAQSANNAFKEYGLTISSVDHTAEQGIITKIITTLIDAIINGITSLLGLNNVNDLIYNGGIRGSSTYNYGTMTDNWWNVVLRYHLIFQAIAWFIIIVGFLKTLISLNLSTINPATRENVYQSIQKFLVTGFLLVLIIPMVQFAMSFNASIVGIFASQVDTSLVGAPAVAGVAGIIVSLVYLAIEIYINFVYIMRSITIALLIVSAPFFISTLSISSRGSTQLFQSWLKELLANIFLQSVHAFTMAFLVNLIQSGTGLESIVIAFSIIPITEMFRALILQGGAGNTEGLAKQAAAKYTNMASNTATALAGGVAGTAGALIARGSTPEGEGSGLEDGSVGSGARGGARGGGGQGSGEQGFTSLHNAIKPQVSALRESGLQDRRDGNKAKGTTKIAAAHAIRGLTGFGMATKGITDMATNMAMSEFTGNTAGYGTAGAIAGGLQASAIDRLSHNAQDWRDEKRRPADMGANDNAVSDAEINGLASTKGELKPSKGNMYSLESSELAMAVENGGSSGEIASKMQTALEGKEGSKAAASWLASRGIYHVQKNDSGIVSFERGRATGSASRTSFNNGRYTTLHNFAAGTCRTEKTAGGKSNAIWTMDQEQYEQMCARDAGFAQKFGGISFGSNHGADFGDSSYSVADGQLSITFRDAQATQNGHGVVTTGQNIRNLYQMHGIQHPASTDEHDRVQHNNPANN